MADTFTFHLTDEDVMDAKRYGVSDQVLCLLATRTGTLWSLAEYGGALEVMAPFRSVRFLVEVDGVWQSYGFATPLPCCLRVEVEAPEAESIAEAPPGGIADQAHRFLQARADKARLFARLATPG